MEKKSTKVKLRQINQLVMMKVKQINQLVDTV